jgi:hypothetical protein
LEIVLKVQVKTYPRTSCVRSSVPVFGPYLTINRDESTLGPCNQMAAKPRQCFVVNDMAFMEIECVLLV